MIIKRHPEDFRVEELLAPEAATRISAEAGPHALCRLTKRSLGTDETIERVARSLCLPLEAIRYVGLKDKHALAVQYISIELPRHRAKDAPRRAGNSAQTGIEISFPALVAKPGWKLERIGWLKKAIAPEDIAGNRFRITVRGLTRRECEGLSEAAKFFAVSSRGPRTLRFVNYYGEQRFGSARHRQGFAARHLIKGEFEEALRLLIAVPDRKDSRERRSIKRTLESNWRNWTGLLEALPPGPERRAIEHFAADGIHSPAAFAALPPFIQRITIEAYQSRLWNEIARRVIVRTCAGPFANVTSRFGELVIPQAAGIPTELAGLVIPLLSPETILREPWKDAAEMVLAEEGVTLRELRIPGLRRPYFGETPRSLFVEASQFSLGPFELDESASDKRRFKRRLKFFLPRGAYATVLLAALNAQAQKILQ